MLRVCILIVKVNWSTRAGTSCTRACKFMEVASPVAWTEASKCLATKEEFDLSTWGSPLEAGHCLLYYACSLPCCVRTRLTASRNDMQYSSSFKFTSVSRSLFGNRSARAVWSIHNCWCYCRCYHHHHHHIPLEQNPPLEANSLLLCHENGPGHRGRYS